MLASELLERARLRLRDTHGSHSKRLWSDYELLVEYGNSAIDKLFLGVRKLIIDSNTAVDMNNPPLPLCTLPLKVGVADYPVSPKIIEIVSGQLNFAFYPLEITTVAEMDAKYRNWRHFGVGAPRTVIIDLNTDSLRFWPTPSASPDPNIVWNPVASFTVHRFMLQRLSLLKSGEKWVPDDSIQLTFREEYQEYLVYGILAEAYSKDDAETKKPVLADLNEKRFNEKIESIKDDLSRRTRVNRGMRTKKAYR